MHPLFKTINSTKKFLKEDLWLKSTDHLPKHVSFAQKQLKSLIIATKGFIDDNVGIRASALTYYSVLSIVPVLAVAFGVAQGFGLEGILEEEIRKAFSGQEEVMAKAIEFSRASLKTSKGGVIAGISVIFLLWAVIKLMNHIESAFNVVWGVSTPRSFMRKFTDYLTLMLIAPVFIIISSSFTVFLNSQLDYIPTDSVLFQFTGRLFVTLLQFAPYILIWILFTLFYLIMPNRLVKIVPAIIGGVIAGTAFELLQFGYVYFQFAMSRYNTIYGSFAALPLFLIWLQLSWMIILFGAEIAFAYENVNTLNLGLREKNLSIKSIKVISLRIMKLIISQFKKNGTLLNSDQISKTASLPLAVVNQSLNLLNKAQLLHCTTPEKEKDVRYIPALPIEQLTINKLLNEIENHGESVTKVCDDKDLIEIDEILTEIEGKQDVRIL